MKELKQSLTNDLFDFMEGLVAKETATLEELEALSRIAELLTLLN